MSFADPQTVTINSVAQTLPRVSSEKNSGQFRKDDGNVILTVSHNDGKNRRSRHTIRLDHRKIAADPLVTAQNLEYSMSIYLTADVPRVGYTTAEAKQIVDALTAYLTASSGAKTTQLLGGEN